MNNSGDGINIYVSRAANRTIWRNTISENKDSGIEFGPGIDGYNVRENTITQNREGILLSRSNGTVIERNNFSHNGIGILSDGGDNATIRSNLFSDNDVYGAQIKNGNYSMIWQNSFFRNNGATDTYDEAHRQACDNGTGNRWYYGTTGNYWDDWRNVSEGEIMTDPYPVACGAGSIDRFPLSDPPFKGPTNVTEFKLSGKVISEGGAPLSGVKVTITEIASGSSVVIVTDDDGNFSRTLHPGQYKVELSKKGYEPKEIELDMPPRDNDLTVVMKKEDINGPSWSLCLFLIIPVLIMIFIMVLVAILFIGKRSRKVPEE
jgi:parallel beta-helix repeat protein